MNATLPRFYESEKVFKEGRVGKLSNVDQVIQILTLHFPANKKKKYITFDAHTS